MKKYLILLAVISVACNQNRVENRNITDLSGEWTFATDSADQGIAGRWFDSSFVETVRLPGSMAGNGKGFGVRLNTDWTGDIVDRSYFEDSSYAKYREPGNIKVPFWLQPVKYYKGAAWYNREVEVGKTAEGNRTFLRLERPHWMTTVYVNGDSIASANSLAVPHEFDITRALKSGKNKIAVRVDNRVVIPIGVNSHSISDHTQGNWNGIAGRIELEEKSSVFIEEVTIAPNTAARKIRAEVRIKNLSGKDFSGKIVLKVLTSGNGRERTVGKAKVPIKSQTERSAYFCDIELAKDAEMWSEFNPAMHILRITLDVDNGAGDSAEEKFGLREFKTNGTGFTVNELPVFLRGTLECCIFPRTGYPPTDQAEWERILGICKSYGLNTIRFHSWCPPEAAFDAADKLGFYFQIECSSWANQGTAIGNGGEVDKFIYAESDRILSEYGNHPSFCMLAYGNEPAGRNQNKFLGDLIKYWKLTDNRRVYTSAAGWPVIPENDFHLTPAPRLQQWGDGLNSIINRQQPNTVFDFKNIISGYSVPVVSHEIGQWCVYPDFTEIEKYTGALKAKNFEIFRESLNDKGMGNLASDFLKASGKLQALCYKAEIEAALRTPGFGGFHLLQLHDFPGQGTALVGILNPFFENKGYVTENEFRMFCNTTVPLARIKKYVYTTAETFETQVEISHWGSAPLKSAKVLMVLKDTEGNTVSSDSIGLAEIPLGNCNIAGKFSKSLSQLKAPAKYRFEVIIEGTEFHNSWDIWVYPERGNEEEKSVYITLNLDSRALQILKSGGSVLWLPYGKIAKGKGAEVAIGFSSVFWNTAWTNNQAPHTLGILCDPSHPVFSEFPTEYHSNWQWWDPITHSQAMILDNLPAGLVPLIQPIDTWFTNRRLALAFEAKCNNGKLMVCSIDLLNKEPDRLASKQLLSSVLSYMSSKSFEPVVEVDAQSLLTLINSGK